MTRPKGSPHSIAIASPIDQSAMPEVPRIERSLG